jgi:hypothetical protein
MVSLAGMGLLRVHAATLLSKLIKPDINSPSVALSALTEGRSSCMLERSASFDSAVGPHVPVSTYLDVF